MSEFEKLKKWVITSEQQWNEISANMEKEYEQTGKICRQHELLGFFNQESLDAIKRLEKEYMIKYPSELMEFNIEIGWGCLFVNDLSKKGIYQILSPMRINELYFYNSNEYNNEEYDDEEYDNEEYDNEEYDDEEYDDEECDDYYEIREYYINMLKNKHKLAFCEYDDSIMLTINLNEVSNCGKNPIYFEDEKIADSIEDFIKQLSCKRDYFIK